MKQALPDKYAKHFEKMAELTYAELTKGRESTSLPHTHKLTSLKKKIFLVQKVPLPGSEMSLSQDACFHDLHKMSYIFCHYKV